MNRGIAACGGSRFVNHGNASARIPRQNPVRGVQGMLRPPRQNLRDGDVERAVWRQLPRLRRASRLSCGSHRPASGRVPSRPSPTRRPRQRGTWRSALCRPAGQQRHFANTIPPSTRSTSRRPQVPSPRASRPAELGYIAKTSRRSSICDTKIQRVRHVLGYDLGRQVRGRAYSPTLANEPASIGKGAR